MILLWAGKFGPPNYWISAVTIIHWEYQNNSLEEQIYMCIYNNPNCSISDLFASYYIVFAVSKTTTEWELFSFPIKLFIELQ